MHTKRCQKTENWQTVLNFQINFDSFLMNVIGYYRS